MKGAVVLFAKVPVHGFPKSRIADEAGRDRAEAIYRELLVVTEERIRGFDYYVSFSGHERPGALEHFFPGVRAFVPQHGDSLGRRVRNALSEVRKIGFDAVCAIGSDCPDLQASDMTTAFDLLDKGRDVVIGPAEDGGYYLIALKDPDCGVFSVTGWSTPDLLKQTEARMEALDLSHALLDVRRDVDTLAAYDLWKRGE